MITIFVFTDSPHDDLSEVHRICAKDTALTWGHVSVSEAMVLVNKALSKYPDKAHLGLQYALIDRARRPE